VEPGIDRDDVRLIVLMVADIRDYLRRIARVLDG
jgi:hypothetical protein